jgi:asparagine synthase (glutamine-hydrolysing)
MCGIFGFLGPSRRSDASVILAKMGTALRHRGPDDEGTWQESGVALGHRRLSILDLTPSGHQPMSSLSGRYVLVFNGEIYNFASLKKIIEKQNPLSWKGHSDTEVLVAGLEVWGWEETLKKLQGMFALAVWDRQEKCLFLARDRMGKKPLYWGRLGNEWVFASELKALRHHPSWTGEFCNEGLTEFFRNGYVPGPWSAYAGLFKLDPGTWVRLSLESGEIPEPTPYWSLNPFTLPRFEGSYDEAVDALDELLTDAVACRMVADVPVGAFLSGGIDSSLVTALMAKSASKSIRTFTMASPLPQYDESPFARAVALHLGTQHTEQSVSVQAALDLVPRISEWFDEPFADSSQIPSYLVAKATRQDVTVALSGDGGDEMFGGYGRYTDLVNYNKKLGRVPKFLLRGMGWAFDRASKSNPAYYQRAALMKSLLSGDRTRSIYTYQMAHFKMPTHVYKNGLEAPSVRLAVPWQNTSLSPVERAMWQDGLDYLPDDVMTKVDRTTMAVSLEARAPLLDHRVVEFAWSLPLEYKWTPDGGKRILKTLLGRYLPQELIDRPKKGFSLPIKPWLKGSLRDWAEDLFSQERLKRQGFLNERLVRRLWKSFLEDQHDWSAYLWDIAVFQSWLEVQEKSV